MPSPALLDAALHGDLQKVQRLLNQGRDVDSINEHGNTALILASEKGHLDIVQLLLKKNAKVDIQDKDGDTALMCASYYGHLEVVKALLSRNANIDIRNKQGCTALIISSDYGHLEIAHLLIGKNAKLDIQDEDGDTALICACRRGRKDCIRALLEHGADTRIKNKAGKIARDCMKDIVQILDEHESKNKNANLIPTAQETELVLEPLNKALEKDNQRLKLDNAVFKEREVCKKELLDGYQAQNKDLLEENARLKTDLKDIQNGDHSVRDENLVLKERGISQMAEIQRLRNELALQEQRYQRRREEDMLLERERREGERKLTHETMQIAIESMMNCMEDRKRKRNDDSRGDAK